MRLLNSSTKELKTFFEDNTPPYAILSHTWEQEEVTFQDLESFLSIAREMGIRDAPHSIESRKGLRKIDDCCALAREKSYEWVWIDTCCIDKTSSAELSEAINSMYLWYQKADVCWVFLSDVTVGDSFAVQESLEFRSSRWWTRGWTLQELIAPNVLEFYGMGWEFIAHRGTLRGLIEEITGIPGKYFFSQSPFDISKSVYDASVAQRMSWAAKRQTTRREDMAYCLMGLFDVNMPLLYGEGDKAFRRLQEEIMSKSNDQSIFAWGLRQHSPRIDQSETMDEANSAIEAPDFDNDELAILASWPSDFVHCGRIIPCQAWQSPSIMSFVKVKSGLRIELPIVIVTNSVVQRGVYGLLNCRCEDDFVHVLAIPIGNCSSHKPFRVGKEFCVERRLHHVPIWYNYFRHKGSSVMHMAVITDDRSLRSKNTISALTLFPAIIVRLWASVYPIEKAPLVHHCLIEETEEISFHSCGHIDPSLELIRGQGHVVIREKTTGVNQGPRMSHAFIYYKSVRLHGGAESRFILEIVRTHSTVNWKSEFRVSITTDTRASTHFADLSQYELRALPWDRKARSGALAIQISERFTRDASSVLGIPANLFILESTLLQKLRHEGLSSFIEKNRLLSFFVRELIRPKFRSTHPVTPGIVSLQYFLIGSLFSVAIVLTEMPFIVAFLFSFCIYAGVSKTSSETVQRVWLIGLVFAFRFSR